MEDPFKAGVKAMERGERSEVMRVLIGTGSKVAPQKVSIINRNFCFLDEMCDENIPLPGFN